MVASVGVTAGWVDEDGSVGASSSQTSSILNKVSMLHKLVSYIVGKYSPSG